MSLLMEALKKAEEAKRLGGESQAAPPSATAPAAPPITRAKDQATSLPGDSPLPNLAQHVDAVDTDLAALSTAPPVWQASPADRNAAERTAARNLFAAKQAPGSSTVLWLLGGAGALAALVLGGYFWWQLQGIPSQGLARPPAATQAPLSPTVAAGGDAPRPKLESLPAVAVAPEAAKPAAPVPATMPDARTPREERPYSPPTATPQRETGDTQVRLSRTPPRTNTVLERAYDTLQAGRLDEAQRDYEQVLRSDAKNTDALLGLATLAARQGQAEKAHAYYLRALESNPNDATAKAGVINARGQADADFSESRLKTALASEPDSPALLFALGNLYARQGRWSEAQQVYFRTYATEPDNPDFIFNLAVSLDNLRQNKLASQYYQMALTAGETRAVSFDRNQARTRVLELQP